MPPRKNRNKKDNDEWNGKERRDKCTLDTEHNEAAHKAITETQVAIAGDISDLKVGHGEIKAGQKIISNDLKTISRKIHGNGDGLEDKQEDLEKEHRTVEKQVSKMSGQFTVMLWILGLGIPGTMALISGLIFIMIQQTGRIADAIKLVSP